MAGKSVEKVLIYATGKVDGKAKQWVAACFNSLADAKPWVALAKLAYASGNADMVKAMDVHAPTTEAHPIATDVKYSAAVVQYAPDAPGLDDEMTLG